MIDLGYARSRFCSALVIVACGATMIAGTFAFAAANDRWLAFAAACAILITLVLAFAARGRGIVQRLLDVLMAAICAWTIVCSRAVESAGGGSSASSVHWLNFASGAALCSLGAISLLIHEFGLQRELEWAGERLIHDQWRAHPNFDATDIHASTRYSDASTRTTR